MIGRRASEKERDHGGEGLDSTLSVNVGVSFLAIYLFHYYLKHISFAEFEVLFGVNSLPEHSKPFSCCWDCL